MQRCSIWTVSLAAALSLTGAAWAEHGEGGGHGPAGGHGTTPTFAKQRESHESHEARESHSGAHNSGAHSAAGSNFAARLANDPTLSARLLALLPSGFCGASACKPADLVTLATMGTGFRNQGQFIAALHVAKNLGLSTMQLKTLLTDMTTKGDRDSLGQALQELTSDPKQNLNLDPKTIKTDVTLARQEVKTDLQAARAADKAEDAQEAAANKAAKDKDKAEDAQEAAANKAAKDKDKAEDANEAAKAPTVTTTTGTSATSKP